MMDGNKVNLLSTFDKENRKITFDSNTVEYETDRFENTSGRGTKIVKHSSFSAKYAEKFISILIQWMFCVADKKSKPITCIQKKL